MRRAREKAVLASAAGRPFGGGDGQVTMLGGRRHPRAQASEGRWPFVRAVSVSRASGRAS